MLFSTLFILICISHLFHNNSLILFTFAKTQASLLFFNMFVLQGFLEKTGNVIYETESICALKGSTVNMSCSWDTYPQWNRLINTFWIKRLDMKSLKEYPEYKDRVEYIEDRKNKTAILRLHNITEMTRASIVSD